MNVIDRIIEERKERGITQQKLSEMTGIVQPTIARMESKKSSPTVEFLAKILDALDLELDLKDSFVLPKEIRKYVKGLPYERVFIGRSGDKIYKFGNKYLLKVSKDKDNLRLEKEKNDWISSRIPGPISIAYQENKDKAFYLRTFLNGSTLIEEPYVSNKAKMAHVLKQVILLLRSLDSADCPFKSQDNNGNDFVHGDLCLPNIIIDNNDCFTGFVDVSNAGKGDRNYDYAWLAWSLNYNINDETTVESILKELNIDINPSDYLRYVLSQFGIK